MTQFDATARINVDLSAFSRAASQASTATGAWTTATNQLQASLNRVETMDKRTAQGISTTLNLYKQISSAVGQYASAISKLETNNEKAAKGEKNFNQALTALSGSLSKVEGLSAKEAERLNRTVSLYEKIAKAVNLYANALVKMASLNQTAAQAQAKQAEATAKAEIAATRLAAAEVRLQQAQIRLQQQEERIAQSQQRMAATAQQADTAFNHFSQSTFALRSTLGELDQMYQQILRVMAAIPMAAASAAISQESAFAQVTRVVGEADTATNHLFEGLQKLSTDLPISFEATAKIAQLGAQIGISADQLIEFTRVIASFSITTGISEEQVTLLLGRIAEMENVPVTEYENLASAVLALGIASASTEEEILKVNESIATVSNVFGLSTEATVGLSSALATLRIRPELARGSLTRVFGQLEDAIEGGGHQLQILAGLMGLTADEVTKLRKTDPDAFFLRFVQGMKNAGDQGVSFRSALRDLDITAVRDIDTVSRLANNFDVLSDSVNLSYAAYAKGTELQRQSQAIFDTTSARIGNLGDAFQNFLANAGRPLAIFVGTLAKLGAQMLDIANRVPGVGLVFGTIAAVVTIGGSAFLAYRIACIKALTGIVALREAQRQLGTQTVGLSSVMSALRSTTVTTATAQVELTGTQRVATASAEGLVMAYRGLTITQAQTANSSRILNSALLLTGSAVNASNAAIRTGTAGAAGLTVANRSMAISSTQAATSATAMGSAMAFSGQAANRNTVALTTTAAATRTAAVATTELSIAARTMSFLAGPWGIALTLVGTAAAFMIPGMLHAKSATDKLTDSAIQSAGGLGELSRALEEDTKAAAQGAVPYRTLVVSKNDLTAATIKAANASISEAKTQKANIELVHGSVSSLTEQSHGHGVAATSAKAYLAQIANANKTIKSNTDLLKQNNVAIGESSKKWIEAAFDAATLESGITKNKGALKELKATSVDVGSILQSSLTDPVDAAHQLDSAIAKLQTRIDSLQQDPALGDGLSVVDQKDLDNTLKAKQFLDALKGSTSALGQEAAATAVKQQLLGDKMEQTPVQAQLAAKGFGDVATAIGALGEEATGFDSDLDALSSTLQGFGTPLDAFKTAWDAVAASTKKATDDTKKGTTEAADSLTAFSNGAKVSLNEYIKELDKIIAAQRNWAANIVILTARLGPDIARELAALGPEAAPMIQKFVDSTDKELAKLKPRLEATTKSSTDAMAATILASIPKMAGVSAQTANVIATSLTNELAAGKVPFETVLNDFAKLVDGLKAVKGKPAVELQTKDAKLALDDLIKLIQGTSTRGDLDPKGKAKLNTGEFSAENQRLLNKLKNLEDAGAYNPNGTADLDTSKFNTQLGDLTGGISRHDSHGDFDPKGTAKLDQSSFNKTLGNLEVGSARTGRIIQANLTRHATVTVGYTYKQNNSPPPLSGVLHAADGGWIKGPGGPRADKVPTMLSNDEFVVNAHAAKANAALLQAINSKGGQGTSGRSNEMMGGSNKAQGAASTTTSVPRAAQALQAGGGQPAGGINITVHNQYPQAEPTSRTVNRALAFAATLNGTI